MKRLLALLVVAVAVVLATGSGPAQATNECRRLAVCVPVAGPWVVLPSASGALKPRVEYQLSCPRGYVVAGLDAELSDRRIDLAFLGLLGSPVSPGITTSRAVVFVGRYTGASARRVSFRPHIGCVPATGGGERVPTAAVRVFPPGQPAVRRVRTVRIRPGTMRAVRGCARAERLVSASHAVGFYTSTPPPESLIASVSTSQSVRSRYAIVSVRSGEPLRRVRAVVQVSAICAGGE